MAIGVLQHEDPVQQAHAPENVRDSLQFLQLRSGGAYMILLTESICPLCSQVFPTAQLHEHIISEHPQVRKQTINVIQAYHPGWAAEHGACEPCWRSFRSASSIIQMLQSSKPQRTQLVQTASKPLLEKHHKP
jgi:hypothetical protein